MSDSVLRTVCCLYVLLQYSVKCVVALCSTALLPCATMLPCALLPCYLVLPCCLVLYCHVALCSTALLPVCLVAVFSDVRCAGQDICFWHSRQCWIWIWRLISLLRLKGSRVALEYCVPGPQHQQSDPHSAPSLSATE